LEALKWILIILGLGLGVSLLTKLFTIAAYVYELLHGLLIWVTKPLAWLGERIGELYNILIVRVDKNYVFRERIYSLDCKWRSMGGAVPVLLGLASVAFTVISSLGIIIFTQDTLGDVLERILFNTTFGAFVQLLMEGFSFSPAAIITAAFAGLLSNLCMGRVSKVKWYYWIPYCVIFICMAALLTSFLAAPLEALGLWAYNTIVSLWRAKDVALYLQILKLIPLILLGYLAVVSLAVIVREYFCSIIYGIAALVVLAIVQFGLEKLGLAAAWVNIIVHVLLICIIVAIEYVRELIDEYEADLLD